jgi:bacteriocin-like protein
MAKPVDVKRDQNNQKRELTIDELNAVTGGAGQTQGESKGTQSSNSDRRKSGLDNIQKFLDILRSMNPQI